MLFLSAVWAAGPGSAAGGEPGTLCAHCSFCCPSVTAVDTDPWPLLTSLMHTHCPSTDSFHRVTCKQNTAPTGGGTLPSGGACAPPPSETTDHRQGVHRALTFGAFSGGTRVSKGMKTDTEEDGWGERCQEEDASSCSWLRLPQEELRTFRGHDRPEQIPQHSTEAEVPLPQSRRLTP